VSCLRLPERRNRALEHESQVSYLIEMALKTFQCFFESCTPSLSMDKYAVIEAVIGTSHDLLVAAMEFFDESDNITGGQYLRASFIALEEDISHLDFSIGIELTLESICEMLRYDRVDILQFYLVHVIRLLNLKQQNHSLIRIMDCLLSLSKKVNNAALRQYVSAVFELHADQLARLCGENSRCAIRARDDCLRSQYYLKTRSGDEEWNTKKILGQWELLLAEVRSEKNAHTTSDATLVQEVIYDLLFTQYCYDLEVTDVELHCEQLFELIRLQALDGGWNDRITSQYLGGHQFLINHAVANDDIEVAVKYVRSLENSLEICSPSPEVIELLDLLFISQTLRASGAFDAAQRLHTIWEQKGKSKEIADLVNGIEYLDLGQICNNEF